MFVSRIGQETWHRRANARGYTQGVRCAEQTGTWKGVRHISPFGQATDRPQSRSIRPRSLPRQSGLRDKHVESAGGVKTSQRAHRSAGLKDQPVEKCGALSGSRHRRGCRTIASITNIPKTSLREMIGIDGGWPSSRGESGDIKRVARVPETDDKNNLVNRGRGETESASQGIAV
jgi:hypothetical protein